MNEHENDEELAIERDERDQPNEEQGNDLLEEEQAVNEENAQVRGMDERIDEFSTPSFDRFGPANQFRLFVHIRKSAFERVSHQYWIEHDNRWR
jgi:hypothetical protein